MKPLVFLENSLDAVRAFPETTRRGIGLELWQVQNGLPPRDFWPMPDIGPGVNEIRIHRLGEWRVIYVAKFDDAVYILHAFEKKSRTTRLRVSSSHDNVISGSTDEKQCSQGTAVQRKHIRRSGLSQGRSDHSGDARRLDGKHANADRASRLDAIGCC